MEKTIEVNGKTFKVRELLATELDDILALPEAKQHLKLQVTKSTGISEEEYLKLTVKERLAILLVTNDLNGLNEDFQKSLK